MEKTLYPPEEPVTKAIRVAFHTLGCKLNFSETATIARSVETENFQRVSFDSFAEVYVINTCSVTENADKRVKGLVKKVLQQNPEGFVVAIGCYAQLQPDAIAALEGVEFVFCSYVKINLY
jgi:threonylcarbamoyladenosine tRNA methylthiotransferase MtaB